MQSDPAHVEAVEIRQQSDNALVFAGSWQSVSVSSRQWQETVNQGLAANTAYRIWVAYNKPMRWLNTQDEPVNFTGLTGYVGPRFEIEGVDTSGNGFDTYFTGQTSDWLTEPGGPSQGYLRYKADAFMFDFTTGSDYDPAIAPLLALAFDNRDIAAMMGDADPATKADYGLFWNGFEETNGAESDFGGIDRTIRITDDGSATFTDPASVTVTPPPPPPTVSSGGGGGSMGIISLIMALLLILRGFIGYPSDTKFGKTSC